MTTEKTVLNRARGLYRWERNEGWERDEHEHLTEFSKGDAVCIDPFTKLTTENPSYLWPVYCEFRKYVTDDIAKVYIPPAGEDNRSWFKEGEGEYLIHEGYLTPQ